MSCQSAPERTRMPLPTSGFWVRMIVHSVGGPMRCPWYLFHRLF
ncbi:unnamed protein product [Staurois parvus]|uniref:Uncharacterized protein n=1 Tax=Staurois parvus TaxID=386267 RepID=A0ABN9E9S2_9NEOB|nr:unnamed protein product [Staurois parvus]